MRDNKSFDTDTQGHPRCTGVWIQIAISQPSAATTPVGMLAVSVDRCWLLSAWLPRAGAPGGPAVPAVGARGAMRRRTITIASPQQRHCSLGRALNGGCADSCMPGAHGGKRRIRLDGTEFVRRFLLHILPTGAKRIRHCGVLASACKRVKLAAARQALQMPVSNPQAMECARAFMVRVALIDALLCPCCKVGRLHITAVLTGQARVPAPGHTLLPQGRGHHDRLLCQ